jgi:fructan beta-fructosidase
MKHFSIFNIAVLLSLISAGTSFSAAAASVPTYREQWRPQFHFTPATNWMNDPNGMVFYDGEYHLFYQFNPFGIKWGHMSWGHAVSRDLVHWEHLPVALYEDNDVMIFSGSVVIDWKNTSSFGKDGKPPMVAIYTGHYTKKPLQNQHIAYSNDRGRTWTKFAGNPVLDIGAKDFRDPKVIWHEPTKRWVMTVAWPIERKVRFYSSPNLKDWTHLSDFGPAGSTNGIWECPDLFPLTVERSKIVSRKSEIINQRWALIVNVGSGAPAGGSGCQYFVGSFDGQRFMLDSANQPPLWADFGADFYAAVSWSDIPRRDGRRLWLGWMSNWQYANDVPTTPWRSAMSIARELSLRNTGDGLRLAQRPVKEMKVLRGRHEQLALKKVTGQADLSKLDGATTELFELEAELQPGDDALFALKLRTGAAEETVLLMDIPSRKMALNRTRSGKVNFHEQFAGSYSAPIRLIDGRLKLRLFVDASSLEVFVNDGEMALSSLILPSPKARHLELEVAHGTLHRATFDAWTLKSAWNCDR